MGGDIDPLTAKAWAAEREAKKRAEEIRSGTQRLLNERLPLAVNQEVTRILQAQEDKINSELHKKKVALAQIFADDSFTRKEALDKLHQAITDQDDEVIRIANLPIASIDSAREKQAELTAAIEKYDLLKSITSLVNSSMEKKIKDEFDGLQRKRPKPSVEEMEAELAKHGRE